MENGRRDRSMKRASFKQVERRLAKKLGGQRQPLNGSSGPDVKSSWLSVEVKTRKNLPDWLFHALSQAEKGTEGGKRLPVAFLKETGKHMVSGLVVMKFSDFMDWFGGK